MRKTNPIIAVMIRELRRIASDRNIFTIVLIAPLFYAFFYGTIYIEKREALLPVIVVDYDRSEFTRELVKEFDAHQTILITGYAPDLTEAERMLLQGEVNGVLFIPEGLTASYKAGKSAGIKLYLNTVRFLVSNDLLMAFNDVLIHKALQNRISVFRAKGFSHNQAFDAAEPIRENIVQLSNPGGNYGDFIIPGLIILIIHQTMLIGLAESIAREREDRTVRDLIARGGGSVLYALMGKFSVFISFFFIYSLFFYVVNFSVLSIPIAGSFLLLLFITIAFLPSVVFMAVFISSFFKRKIYALQALAFSTYPFFFLTGYSWPLSGLPEFLKVAGNVFPITPMLDAFIKVTRLGAGFEIIAGDLIHLTLLSMVYGGLAYFRLRRLNQKEA